MFMSNFLTRDPFRPSFFEMYAQQQLVTTMKPALKYAFSVLAMRNRSWETAVTYTDELFAVVWAVVERHYLSHYEASFAEVFYGLRRAKSDQVDPAIAALRAPPSESSDEEYVPSLKPRDVYSSLIFMIGVPYLKGKADAIYKSFTEGEGDLLFIDNENNNDQERWSDCLRRWGVPVDTLAAIYPYFNAVYEGSTFAYQLLYMHDYVRYFHWSLHFLKIDVKRAPMQHMALLQRRRTRERERMLARFGGTGVLMWLIRLLLRISHAALDYSHFLLPLGIFVFKFLEWWYSENKLTTRPRPIPPPPAPLPVRGVALPTNKSLCPLCGDERTNPAIVPESGYVFCYPCVFHFVEREGACPVSGIAATAANIKRLYEST